MKTAITLRYSEKLIRSAVRAFWWRSTGWSYIGSLVLVLVVVAYDVSAGDRSWVVGVLGCLLVMAVIVSVALYAVHYRGSLGRLRRMSVPQAVFEPAEETFKISSDVGMVELPWGAVKEVWRFPAFWLLFTSRAQFITLPLEDLDSEVQQFVLDNIRTHGGKIA